MRERARECLSVCLINEIKSQDLHICDQTYVVFSDKRCDRVNF